MSSTEGSPTLYYSPLSFYSQKALLALVEKGLPFRRHVVDMIRHEIYDGWFLKLNPRGQVPVLVDRGKVIPDSSAIIRHVDDNYDGPKLMPEAGQEQWADYQKRMEAVRVEVLTYGSIMYPEVAKTKDIQLPKLVRTQIKKNMLSNNRCAHVKEQMAKNPDMVEIYKRKLKECAELENSFQDKEALVEEMGRVRELLADINKDLQSSQGDWLCGRDLTVADICLAVLLQRLHMLGFSRDLWCDGRLPAVAAYFTRLNARPAFKEVCIQMFGAKDVATFVLGPALASWAPVLVGGLALVASVGVGYALYRKS